MKGTLLLDEALRDRLHVFADRRDAGMKLSEKLTRYRHTNALVLAIPAGGVPVASEIARALKLPIDLILSRKIQIPWNTEAGFGAMAPDGEVILNSALLNRIGSLTEDEIDAQIHKTRAMLKKRNEIFRAGNDPPDVTDKTVILVDDGLASGYTMLAALRYVRKREPQKLVVAVPTGSWKTVDSIVREVDELICLNVRGGFAFAVADAYRSWHDLSDDDVISIMEQFHSVGG